MVFKRHFDRVLRSGQYKVNHDSKGMPLQDCIRADVHATLTFAVNVRNPSLVRMMRKRLPTCDLHIMTRHLAFDYRCAVWLSQIRCQTCMVVWFNSMCNPRKAILFKDEWSEAWQHLGLSQLAMPVSAIVVLSSFRRERWWIDPLSISQHTHISLSRFVVLLLRNYWYSPWDVT